jgi:hypothetical protein
MTTVIVNRRAVRGNAFRDCEFCGRDKTDGKGQKFNYQYINEHTGSWDAHVFCSKTCYSAWHGMNGGR